MCLATFRWIRITVQTTCGADSPVVCEKVPIVHSVLIGTSLPDETGNDGAGAEFFKLLLEVTKLFVYVFDALTLDNVLGLSDVLLAIQEWMNAGVQLYFQRGLRLSCGFDFFHCS